MKSSMSGQLFICPGTSGIVRLVGRAGFTPALQPCQYRQADSNFQVPAVGVFSGTSLHLTFYSRGPVVVCGYLTNVTVSSGNTYAGVRLEDDGTMTFDSGTAGFFEVCVL